MTDQPTAHNATPVCTVETHIVVACPATVWRHTDGTNHTTFGTPYECDENPFAGDGDVWDPTLEDWMTSARLADAYDLPYPVALNVAIGPRIKLDLAGSDTALRDDLDALWRYIRPDQPDAGPSAADVCDALYGLLNRHGWPVP
jgi:hypothetical protein